MWQVHGTIRHRSAEYPLWIAIKVISVQLPPNQVRDRIGLRYEGNVTRFYLDRFRAYPLGHEAFEIGVDGPIFSGHGIPAWLRPPCRVRGFAGEQGLMERPLDRVQRPWPSLPASRPRNHAGRPPRQGVLHRHRR